MDDVPRCVLGTVKFDPRPIRTTDIRLCYVPYTVP